MVWTSISQNLHYFQSMLSHNAFYYALLAVVYVLMFGVMLRGLHAQSAGARAAPAATSVVCRHDLPPHLVRILAHDAFNLAPDAIEAWALRPALGARDADAAREPLDVLVVAHPALPPSHRARLARWFPQHRYRSLRAGRAKGRAAEVAGARLLEREGRARRKYDVVCSVFDANSRNRDGIERHVRKLRDCAKPGGTVFVRMLLRQRKDKDAVVARFDRHFAAVSYGLLNYSLFYPVHMLTLAQLLWHELQFGRREQCGVRRGEWWNYGQLMVVATR